MHGLSDTIRVEGVGWVEWHIRDAFGQVALIRTRAYYIPTASIRIYSPQSYFTIHERGNGSFDHHKVSITTADGVELVFPFTRGSNLPLMYLDDSVLTAGLTGHLTLTLKSGYCASKITNILEHNNLNLSAPQKEVGLWHFRFAHCGIPWVQSLMRVEKVEVGSTGTPPIIPTRNKTICKVDPPKCPGCILAKQH